MSPVSGIMMPWLGSESLPLEQWLSIFSEHQNQLPGLLKHRLLPTRFSFNGHRVGPKNLYRTSSQLMLMLLVEDHTLRTTVLEDLRCLKAVLGQSSSIWPPRGRNDRNGREHSKEMQKGIWPQVPGHGVRPSCVGILAALSVSRMSTGNLLNTSMLSLLIQ